MALELQQIPLHRSAGRQKQERKSDSVPSIFVAEASARELAHLELALRRANVVCDLLVPKDTKQALLFINSLTPSSLPYPTLALISVV